MHKVTVRKIGNSYGVILPKEELESRNVALGDVLMLARAEDGWRLVPFDEAFQEAMAAYEEGRVAYRNTLRELAK